MEETSSCQPEWLFLMRQQHHDSGQGRIATTTMSPIQAPESGMAMEPSAAQLGHLFSWRSSMDLSHAAVYRYNHNMMEYYTCKRWTNSSRVCFAFVTPTLILPVLIFTVRHRLIRCWCAINTFTRIPPQSSMVAANDAYRDSGCLVDFFCNPGLKNGRRGRGRKTQPEIGVLRQHDNLSLLWLFL